MATQTTTNPSSTITSAVNSHYSSAALASENKTYSSTVAQAFGYTPEELATIPSESNLGLSCGNPLTLASLKEGETTLDLGSGAGFDVFLASKKVGEKGKAIGVDMNKDMLAKARQNALKTGANNVEFVENEITSMSGVESSTVDCVISNCVVNLVAEEEKQKVFNEMFRVLKSGGRVAISDILAKRELTPDLKNSMALLVGCIAGASMLGKYEEYLKNAGFGDILILNSNHDLNIYKTADSTGQSLPCCPAPSSSSTSTSTPASTNGTTSSTSSSSPSCCAPKQAEPKQTSSCCAPKQEPKQEPKQSDNNSKEDYRKRIERYKDVDFNAWAGSYQIYAVKP